MYLNEDWTFLVELKGDPPLAALGVCLVDLSTEDDRGDVEPYVDGKGILHCTLGAEPTMDGDEERREIVGVWEYCEDQPFNEKFPFFRRVGIVDFVRRMCDAATFDGDGEDGIRKLKEHYGVLSPTDVAGCPREAK